MRGCPVCAELRGEKAEGKLCSECDENWDLGSQWAWYGLVKNLKRDGIVFLYAYWFLVVGLSLSGWIGFWTAVWCSGLWVFNLWAYRRKDYKKRLDEEKGKLFLMRLRGKEGA